MIACSVPSAALATRWVSVSKDDERQYYIDLDAVVVDGLVRTVWLKTVIAQPLKKREASRIEKWMHDCENERVKLLAVTTYRENGEVLGSGEAPHYTQGWQKSSYEIRTSLVHAQVCGSSPNLNIKPKTTNTDATTS